MHSRSFKTTLSTLEVRGELLPAGVKEQAQGDGNVEVNPQNVGLNSSAEASSHLEIKEPFQEGAAGQVRRAPDDGIDGSVENLRAHSELEGVPGAAPIRGRVGVRVWLGLGAGVAAAG